MRTICLHLYMKTRARPVFEHVLDYLKSFFTLCPSSSVSVPCALNDPKGNKNIREELHEFASHVPLRKAWLAGAVN